MISVGFLERLLPGQLLARCEQEEKCMQGVSYFVLNLLRDTIKMVENNTPKALDAYPGDGNCQSRLAILPELFENRQVLEEMSALKKICTTQLQLLAERRKKPITPVRDFFNCGIGSLSISADIQFLMDCRLLNITRVPHSSDASGVIYLKTDHGKLSSLFKYVPQVEGKEGNFRREITLNACSRLSSETMSRLQQICRRKAVSELVQRMIDHVIAIPYDQFPPKIFGCQFFTVKVAFYQLLDKKIPIIVQTIVPKGQQNESIFFLPQEEDFVFQDRDAIHGLQPSHFVAIFKGVVPSIEILKSKVKEIGFIELVLCYASQQDPFQPGSSPQDVQDKEAYALLENYRSKSQEFGCLKNDVNTPLKLHHLYCDTLQSILQEGIK